MCQSWGSSHNNNYELIYHCGIWKQKECGCVFWIPRAMAWLNGFTYTGGEAQDIFTVTSALRKYWGNLLCQEQDTECRNPSWIVPLPGARGLQGFPAFPGACRAASWTWSSLDSLQMSFCQPSAALPTQLLTNILSSCLLKEIITRFSNK